MMTHQRVGREYLRVSVDKTGRQRSTTEQHTDNARAAAERGIQLAEAYVDLGSASRYARRGREGFTALLDDLEHDRFAADLLVLWESSRGSRRVGEWVQLIELCEDRHVRIFVTTHGREYDPANPRDRRSLLEDAVDSEYESAKIATRVKRSVVAAAAKGRPHGRPPFGYERRYDPRTGELVSQDPHPVQAPVVQELFRRVAAGHSIRGILKDWSARGVERRPGVPFTPAAVHWMLRNQAYAGVRVHAADRGVPVRTPGAWPALVSVDTWHAVQALLSQPGRRVPYRPSAAVHLLSMIAQCEPCGGVLSVRVMDGVSRYRCHARGCVMVWQAELDQLAETAMLGYLSEPGLRERLTAGAPGAGEWAQVRGEVAAIRAELDELAAEVGAGRLSPRLAAVAEPGIRERLAAAEQREAVLATPSPLLGMLPAGVDVGSWWELAPISTRRAVARVLLGDRGLMGTLRVTRTATPGPVRCPVSRRVRWGHEVANGSC